MRLRRSITRSAVAWCAILLAARAWASADIDHAPWDQLLNTYVHQGLVDYERLAAHRGALDQYLAALKTADVAALPSKEARLAFWVNAYNALVWKGVLDHYPLKSVHDVKGFFDGIRYDVAGESWTLNQIEERGRALGDWRIHFAVVCASSSCPPLRSEAYVAARLSDQLADQTATFLRNPELGVRLDKRTLYLSKIFTWYAKDFFPNERSGLFARVSASAFLDVLGPSLSPDTAQAIKDQQPTTKPLPYDWTLNDAALHYR